MTAPPEKHAGDLFARYGSYEEDLMRKLMSTLMLAVLLLVPVAGCEMSCRSDNDLEDAVEDAGDAVEDAADELDG